MPVQICCTVTNAIGAYVLLAKRNNLCHDYKHVDYVDKYCTYCSYLSILQYYMCYVYIQTIGVEQLLKYGWNCTESWDYVYVMLTNKNITITVQ